MDSEPVSVSKTSPKPMEDPKRNSIQDEAQGGEDDDPLSLSGPSMALLGLAIAISTVGIPFLAVFTERPIEREGLPSNQLEINGSKSPSPFSFRRVGKSSSRNSSRK